MKIIILNAVKDWVNKQYGPEQWKEIAESTGIGVDQFTQQAHYISEDRFKRVVESMCKTLNLDTVDLNNKFIEYWMTDFAPRVYNYMIKKSETIKDFVQGIFKLNNDVTNLFPNNMMTKFDVQQTGKNSLTAIYPSEQTLVDIIAVLRGAALFFPQKFNIRKINPHSVEIIFD